jgi:hypothetical protein
MRRNALTRSLVALAAVAALAPAAALAQASPATQRPRPSYGYGPQRDSWYIGFGLGSGFGSGVYGGQRIDLGDVYSGGSTPLSLQFEIGATLRPDLLFGLDLRAFRHQASGPYDVAGLAVNDPAIQITQALAMMTWFPARNGLYLRGGLGLAQYHEDGLGTASGVSVLAGVGYAMWLGRSFNLSVGLDLSAQGYGDSGVLPSSTRFGELGVGFHWY